MTAAAVEEWKPQPVLRTAGFATKACGFCGWKFFTFTGLYEHTHNCPPKPLSPARQALRERGRQIAQLNNARRRRCHGCGYESTAPGIGTHQAYSGHTGWTDLP